MKRVENWDNLIPSLLALYTLLSDDDEEIRDLAAKTVSFVLKRSLAPPAAREEFIEWFQINYGHSSQFSWNVICRLTGSTAAVPNNSELDALVPAQEQFEKALEVDNGRFVQEEQNLFEDKVIELTLWSKFFWELPLTILKAPRMDNNKSFMLLDFAAWVSDAVCELNKNTSQDGPLGWTWAPLGFTAALRVLRCANTLLNYHHKHFGKSLFSEQTEQEAFLHGELGSHVRDIVFALQTFRDEAIDKDIHPVLIKELRGQKLLDPLPESFLGKMSLKMKHICGVDSDSFSQPLLDPTTTSGDRNV